MRDLQNKHPFVKMIEEELGGNLFTKTLFFSLGYEPVLVIQDVDVVESLYTTHNAHFDKHPKL